MPSFVDVMGRIEPDARLLLQDPNSGQDILDAINRSRMMRAMRNRLAFGVEAGLSTLAPGSTTTYFYVIPIPVDAYAARMVFAQNIGTTWSITSASIAYSDSVSDYINPTVDGSTASTVWTSLTFDNGGADTEKITMGGTVRNFTADAAGGADPLTGSTLVPTFYYSDFVPIAPLSPSPSSAIRYLFVRICVPAQTMVRPTWAPSATQAWTGDAAVNRGFDAAIYTTNTDRATTPAVTTGATSTAGGPLFHLEYMTLVPGALITTLGDSQMEGQTTTGPTPFPVRSALSLSSEKLPVTIRTCAWGGQASNVWWPMFKKMISALPPTVAVLQASSGNDTATVAGYMRGISRSIDAASRVLSAGGVPVLCTPFPRPSDNVQNWQYRRNEVLKIAQSNTDIVVFDCAAGIGSHTNEVYDGGFLSGMSNDNVHPNNNAHEVLDTAFRPVLARILGIS